MPTRRQDVPTTTPTAGLGRSASTWLAAVAVLVGLLSGGTAARAQPGPAVLPAVQALLNAESSLTDLYAAGGPRRSLQRDFQPTTTVVNGQTEVQSDLWRVDAAGRQQQGAFAYGRTAATPRAVVLGTSAVARSDAGYSGTATASLFATTVVTVTIYPQDLALLLEDFAKLSPCYRPEGCILETSFLHETHGQFAWLQGAGDRSASFSETVRVTGSEGTFAAATGSVAIGLRNNVAEAAVTIRGSFDPTSVGFPINTALPDIYPDGDPRNNLGDPAGALMVAPFHHQQVLTAVPTHFKKSLDYYGALEGSYTVSVNQLAMAGIGPDYFNRSTLAVDFADTARFSGLGVVDPTGQLPMDLLDVAFSFTSPVPEPAAVWLWALALPALGVVARRRRARAA